MEMSEQLIFLHILAFPQFYKNFGPRNTALCDTWSQTHVFSRMAAFCFCLPTHHAGCLHRLGHVASIGVTPEDVAVEAMPADIHDEGKRVHVPADTHKGQKTNATLHQHLAFILLAHKRVERRVTKHTQSGDTTAFHLNVTGEKK